MCDVGRGSFVWRRERVGAAARRHRADEALRVARDAESSPRKSISAWCEVEHVPDTASPSPTPSRDDASSHGSWESPVATKTRNSTRATVGVEESRRARGTRSCGWRRRCRRRSPLEREQRRLVRRQLAAVLRHRLACDRLQPLRCGMLVAERIPRLGHVLLRRLRRALPSKDTCRATRHTSAASRSTCVLLQHDLGDGMWYGSSVLRHGRSRPWRPYQVSNRCRNGGDRRAPESPSGRARAFFFLIGHFVIIRS